ncbi:MAG: type II toxin-antitoxin system HipA family toxin [Planctomycetota bacterium]|nr:type II toxin-antitoxin system HipA family toxin [Planctomycetota bacterium]
MTTALVKLWNSPIGAVTWDAPSELGFFEFDPAFVHSQIQVSPLHMPLSPRVYSFPGLDRTTFHGLPGMLADVLPDKFGNALINGWLAGQGRSAASFDPVERLCYTGRRAMGALEFEPAQSPFDANTDPLDLPALVNLAGMVLSDRDRFAAQLREGEEARAMADILRVGTSAGGARAKAVVAWNEATGELRSGQLDLPPGFSHWLIKFDGISNNRDKELADPKGYGRIEYAYSNMAKAAGIEMSECRLLEENGRAHFLTRRFDRTESGSKLHQQSLCALDHQDFNLAGAHSYEGAIQVMRRLGLPHAQLEQQFRRTVFNIVARNQDDHTKNIAFLMDKAGSWSLSPAFDVVYAYNPSGAWTNQHQMSLQGKRDLFTREDFKNFGDRIPLKRGRALAILDEVREAVLSWPQFAGPAGIPADTVLQIARQHRISSTG